jgi:hypothetical protein
LLQRRAYAKTRSIISNIEPNLGQIRSCSLNPSNEFINALIDGSFRMNQTITTELRRNNQKNSCLKMLFCSFITCLLSDRSIQNRV